MTYRSLYKFALLFLLIIAAACAPDNLDITPTPVPTEIPIIKVYVTGAVANSGITVDLPLGSRTSDAIDAAGGATEDADLQRVNLALILSDGAQVNVPIAGEALAEVTEEAPIVDVNDPETFLNRLVELTPENLAGGTVQWRRDPANPPTFAAPRGGNTVRISYTESGGSLLEITYGIFSDAASAQGFYDAIVGSLQAQVRTQEDDRYPTPNQFVAGGTYGSAGIFLLDTRVVRIAVPRYNTASGADPIRPLVEPILGYLTEAQAS